MSGVRMRVAVTCHGGRPRDPQSATTPGDEARVEATFDLYWGSGPTLGSVEGGTWVLKG